MRASSAAFDEDHDRVSFVPHEGAYAAGFHPASKHVRVYLDMTTEPVWQRHDDRARLPAEAAGDSAHGSGR